MLEHVLTRRLPFLKVFSNCWTSQSGAETTNSVWQRLGIGASVELSVVLDKLLAYLEREETRPKGKENSTKNLSVLVRELGSKISAKAFSLTLVQFNQACNYNIETIADGSIWKVCRRRNGEERKGENRKEEEGFAPRTVRRNDSLFWGCSCNMLVYHGLFCRHILCVMINLELNVPFDKMHSRWWRDSLQPEVRLLNESPFSKQSEKKSQVEENVQSLDAIEENDNRGRDPVLNVEFEDGMSVPFAAEDFGNFLENNGGKGGQNSMEESASEDAVVLNKASNPIALTASERRNELCNNFYRLVQRIGFGRGCFPVFDDLEKCVEDWEARNFKASEGFSLSASIATVGRPMQHSLKPGMNQARSNGVKVKKTYKCGICGAQGHTASSRCPEKCVDCPQSVKAHKKECCPKAKLHNASDLENRERDEPAAAQFKVVSLGAQSEFKKKKNSKQSTIAVTVEPPALTFAPEFGSVNEVQSEAGQGINSGVTLTVVTAAPPVAVTVPAIPGN